MPFFKDLNFGDKFVRMLPFYISRDFGKKLPESIYGYVKLTEAQATTENNEIVDFEPKEGVIKLCMPE